MNVYKATLKRIEHLYNTYDELLCNLSMGKDSLAMFYCQYEVALKLKREVKVLFYDGEYPSRHSIDLANRIKKLPNVKFYHLTAPTKCRNGTSTRS